MKETEEDLTNAAGRLLELDQATGGGGEIKAETMEAALKIAADPVVPFPLDSHGYSVEGTLASAGGTSAGSACWSERKGGHTFGGWLRVFSGHTRMTDIYGGPCAAAGSR